MIRVAVVDDEALVRSGFELMSPKADVARVNLLTDREPDVLVLIAEGLPDADADADTDTGTRIHLSAGAVEDHVGSILTRLRVAGRVQRALLVERAGLLVERAGLLGDNGDNGDNGDVVTGTARDNR
ncbi:hypothetical protein SMA5143A_7803 [Streptomyces sp. MA5143a]|nr:hypothetical protein SMA5143A_7803 [Streptomyces sp. MA5143a]